MVCPIKVIPHDPDICPSRAYDPSLRLVYPNVECMRCPSRWSFCFLLRESQPYLILSRGRAKADETLLVDYVGSFPPPPCFPPLNAYTGWG
jgi:hypothetical protein